MPTSPGPAHRAVTAPTPQRAGPAGSRRAIVRNGALAAAAVASLAPMVWGTTYAVTTELLPEGHPVFAGVVRSLPAGLVVIALTRSLPRGHWWWRAGVLGALNIGVFFALLFVAAYRLPGGIAATAGALQPLVVIGLAYWLLGEAVDPRRVVYAMVGVAGVALLVLDAPTALDPVGLAAAVAGVASMATGVVLTRRWGRPAGTSLLAFTGWQLTAGGIVLTAVLAATEGVPDTISATAAGGYLWLAVPGSLIAYTLWFRGISRLPASTVAFLGLLSPVVASIVGWVVLGESLTPLQSAGFVVALAAVVAGATRRSAVPAPETGGSAIARHGAGNGRPLAPGQQSQRELASSGG
ncbi:MAG: EamA family transporter [Actinomycetota bacterium]|nr:EamA family transporter [Actinomycetota bacterium]